MNHSPAHEGSARLVPKPPVAARAKAANHIVTSAFHTLDGAGAVTAAQLYAPYGGLCYSSGTLPTARGFTGQRADAATGLDDDGAYRIDATSRAAAY